MLLSISDHRKLTSSSAEHFLSPLRMDEDLEVEFPRAQVAAHIPEF